MGSYLRQIFQPFFRWWWAAITGVASILGFATAPATGITLGPAGVALLLFATFSLLFLTVSVVSISYRWYGGTPSVAIEHFQRGGADEPIRFLLRCDRGELRVGDLIGVYGDPGTGMDVCFSVARVSAYHSDNCKLQAESLWHSATGLSPILRNQIPTQNLKVRTILDGQAQGLIAKHNHDGKRA